MDIYVDLSFFPDNLVPLITNSIEIKSFFVENYSTNSQDRDTKLSLFNFPGSINEFEDLLKSILQKNSINEYVIAQDTETENTLAILKDGDMRQLGILICDFCGAAFSSEEEKYSHHGAHFLF
jgi:hypothetical protein